MRCTIVSLLILSGAPAAGQTPARAEPAMIQPQADDNDLINPDRPGIADGSTVIGRGRVQLESGFQREVRHGDGDAEHTDFVPTLFRVGVSSRWEARFESNTFTHVDVSGRDGPAGSASDWAPLSFGVKFHMQDSGGLRKPSLGTILRVFPESGTGSLHTSHATGDLRFAADWDLTDRFSLNPNAGVAFYEDDDGRRFGAALFALTLNAFNDARTMNPFVDVGLQAPETSGGTSSVILDAGIAYLPGRDVQIDFSAGTGPHGRTPPHPFVAVGLSLRFRAPGR